MARRDLVGDATLGPPDVPMLPRLAWKTGFPSDRFGFARGAGAVPVDEAEAVAMQQPVAGDL